MKNAASAARNAAGASAGTPDFYRIAEIAPLPASFPFKPEMQETKGVGSGSTGILTTRYLIRPLTSEDTLAEMDDLPFQKIAIKEDVSAETEIGLPFSDPFIGEDDSTNFFDSSASSSSEGKVEYPNTTAGQMKSTANSEMRAVTTTRGAGVDGNDSSTDEAALDVGTETTIHQLSKADVSYLAHQNRILLTYFDKQVEAGNNSTLPEIQS